MDLFKYQDLKYKEFNDKILNSKEITTIGIRIPILRKLAKEVALNDYLDYINSKHKYFEEYIIHGLVIGNIKIPFNDKLDMIDKFLPHIHDWATNDIVCSNLKDFKKNQEVGFNYINKLLKGNNWSIRFALILLLDYYINDEYIDKVLLICENVKDNDYYVMMGLSWLLSTCFIKFKDKTSILIKSNKLNKEVTNKTISKICDSYRVSKIDKDEIKKWRK